MYDYLGPRLTEAASRLPSPSISDAIADGDGWHFLRIVRSEPGTPPAFDDIRAQILTSMQRESDDAALPTQMDSSASVTCGARASGWRPTGTRSCSRTTRRILLGEILKMLILIPGGKLPLI